MTLKGGRFFLVCVCVFGGPVSGVVISVDDVRGNLVPANHTIQVLVPEVFEKLRCPAVCVIWPFVLFGTARAVE